jgi:hypothetical protein
MVGESPPQLLVPIASILVRLECGDHAPIGQITEQQPAAFTPRVLEIERLTAILALK